LTTRILKAKYYPRGSILERKLCKNLLFPGEAIYSNMGLLWQIGEGSKVKVWGDKWLPTPTTYSVQSLYRLLGKDARVKELIDVDTRWWNTRLIKEIFMEDEAATICKLPLNVYKHKDVMMWRSS
jgi:hypothetical protein